MHPSTSASPASPSASSLPRATRCSTSATSERPHTERQRPHTVCPSSAHRGSYLAPCHHSLATTTHTHPTAPHRLPNERAILVRIAAGKKKGELHCELATRGGRSLNRLFTAGSGVGLTLVAPAEPSCVESGGRLPAGSSLPTYRSTSRGVAREVEEAHERPLEAELVLVASAFVVLRLSTSHAQAQCSILVPTRPPPHTGTSPRRCPASSLHTSYPVRPRARHRPSARREAPGASTPSASAPRSTAPLTQRAA